MENEQCPSALQQENETFVKPFDVKHFTSCKPRRVRRGARRVRSRRSVSWRSAIDGRRDAQRNARDRAEDERWSAGVREEELQKDYGSYSMPVGLTRKVVKRALFLLRQSIDEATLQEASAPNSEHEVADEPRHSVGGKSLWDPSQVVSREQDAPCVLARRPDDLHRADCPRPSNKMNNERF